jgi:hypothetical protein
VADYKLPQDRFYPLLDAIEAQKGISLPETCNPTTVPLEKTRNPPTTHGCRKHYKLGIPYDAIEQKDGRPVPHDGLAIVCAEGDGVEWWPRFKR